MPKPLFDHFRFAAPIYERFSDNGAIQRKVAEPLALPIAGWLLDAGGGTGRVSKGLVSQTGGVVVADASPGMLRQAGQKPGLLPVYAHVERMPFATGCFERILVVDAFHHFFYHEKAAMEFWRVLKPGGRLVIHEPNISRWPVRLIALAETLLLMRSRFFHADHLKQMFEAQEDAKITVDAESDRFYIQLVAEKLMN